MSMKIDISLDGKPVQGTGVKSQYDWGHLARLIIGARTDPVGYKIVGFTATEEGLMVHWEFKDR